MSHPLSHIIAKVPMVPIRIGVRVFAGGMFIGRAEAERGGAIAAQDGISINANPFPMCTVQCAWWNRGWLSGQQG